MLVLACTEKSLTQVLPNWWHECGETVTSEVKQRRGKAMRVGDYI